MKNSQILLSTSSFAWLIAIASPSSAATWSNNPAGFAGNPWFSGFSPWSMGANPWSTGFSPWSMGTNPWSSGFSPWAMGSNPWSTGFTPWGGNSWNSAFMPWSSGNSWGSSWGNNAWMPWSSGSNFFGRRNNNDWVASMFLMNSLNSQQPWSTGIPNYNYQAPNWQQAPMQAAPNAFYPQQPAMLPNNAVITPTTDQAVQPTESTKFPAGNSSFSPFLEAKPSTINPAPITHPTQPQPNVPKSDPTGKTLVFPDGSRF